MMKVTRSGQFYLTLWLLLLGLAPFSSTAKNPPDFSAGGRPGRQTAGDNRSLCPTVMLPVVALTPASGGGKTLQARPVLWFYLPYTKEQIHRAEFVLQNENREDIQRLSVTLADRPGFTSLTLPVSLDLNQWYVWTLKLNCNDKTSATPIFVEGWIQRVARLDKRQLTANTVSEETLWYDEIDQLALLCIDTPTNKNLKALWNERLARTIERLKPGQQEQLYVQPFVESLKPISD